MCRASRFLTLKDLRVAKLDKRVRMTPCGAEMEQYLTSLSYARGDSDKINRFVSKNLSDCMNALSHRTKPASLAFHIAKFVKR